MSDKNKKVKLVIPASGPRPHRSGAGLHDPRPNRKRSRGDRRRAAIRDALIGGGPVGNKE